MKTGFLLCATLLLSFVFCNAAQDGTMEIRLQKRGEVYTLPGRINGVVTLDFILDSGASEVCIPSNIMQSLLQAGTIAQKDLLPGKNYKMADGSIHRRSRFTIRELDIGGIKIFNVPAGITPKAAYPLLGQSFLNKVASWTLDNRTHTLTLTGVDPASGKQAATTGPDAATKPANASKPSSSTGNTTQSRPDSPKKLLPPSAHIKTKSPEGSDNTKSLIEPSANRKNMP